MDEDIARIMAVAGLRASRELGELVQLLAKHLPEDKQLRINIARAISEIHSATLEPAFTTAPQLEAEFDARINRYGRAT